MNLADLLRGKPSSASIDKAIAGVQSRLAETSLKLATEAAKADEVILGNEAAALEWRAGIEKLRELEALLKLQAETLDRKLEIAKGEERAAQRRKIRKQLVGRAENARAMLREYDELALKIVKLMDEMQAVNSAIAEFNASIGSDEELEPVQLDRACDLLLEAIWLPAGAGNHTGANHELPAPPPPHWPRGQSTLN